MGPIDVWVNNAMVSILAPFKEVTPEEFRRVTEVTYLGYVWGTMGALKRMRPRDHGGWLFGISYAFLLWMLGPVTLVQWVLARPVVMGRASQVLFVSHLLYGLVLGLLFPHVHRLIQRRHGRVE